VQVKRKNLQLVGVAAMLIACKHEEVDHHPPVSDFVYITGTAYSGLEVVAMEKTILYRLNWNISVPKAYPFLCRFLDLIEAPYQVRQGALYYLERTLQEHDMLC
jgi:cyclin B